MWGKRQRMRPDASGSRHRAQRKPETEGKPAAARLRSFAESSAHGGHQQPTGCEGSPEGKHPPMTTSGPTDAPSYR